jgi:hypothetical protein
VSNTDKSFKTFADEVSDARNARKIRFDTSISKEEHICNGNKLGIID